MVCFSIKGVPISSMLLAPAVTPWETTLPGVIGGKGNNPAIRLIKYDRTSGQTLDIAQYYLNLTQANSIAHAQWKLVYNATEYYQLPDMGTQSLHTLAQSFLTDDARFNKYYQANGVLYDPQETCKDECKIIQYCSLTRIDYDDYEACVQDQTNQPSSSTKQDSVFLILSVSMVLNIWL
jgi:sphingomyelin phosphodiesterase acid-like 3